MLKMHSFDINTRSEMFVPLVHCVFDDILSQGVPDLRETLLQFIDVMNFMSVINACPCMHPCRRMTFWHLM